VKLPRCIAEAGACPPEDCGGPPGTERLHEIIANPNHPTLAKKLDCVGGAIAPDAFDPKAEMFVDPRESWRLAFQPPDL
jgi:hypothetical protein